jgi:energy-coupling factor transporter transmembrane protein EcfT
MIEYGFTFKILVNSLINSSITTLKLLDLILLNIIFIKTTSFIELTDSFNRLNLSKKFLFSIMILTSILPLIFKTANQIYDAQRLRGLKKRDFLTINGWILFLSPLFIHVFSYSQQISLQLELKNYSEIIKLEENTPKIQDYFIFAILISISIVLYYWENYFNYFY